MPPSSTPRARKPKRAQAFTRRLIAWFERHGRDLPWRRTRDPYQVLVSEFMLQQTQVSRVAEYYPRFLERFSSLDELARAKPRAVREAWDGLGYYARARNLHALAKQVSGAGGQVPGVRDQVSGVRDQVSGVRGQVPGDPDELIKLPGVGRYTAGAVASFAYEKPVPAVDTNVARVLGRIFFGQRATGNPKGHGGRRLWDLASALVPKDGKRAWKFNQALMELGALVCKARRPLCPECPVSTNCKAVSRGSAPSLTRQPGSVPRTGTGSRP
jgi:A/G-specific adenine glycosylase